MADLGLITLLLLIPAVIFRISRQRKLPAFFSPLILCYALGVAISLILASNGRIIPRIASTLSEMSIVTAMPLLLYGTRSLSVLLRFRTFAFSFLAAVCSSAMGCTAIALLFKGRLPAFHQAGAMLSGLYTGGTPNLQALGLTLGASPALILELTASDAITGAIYLFLLTSILPPLFGSILPPFHSESGTGEAADEQKPTRLESPGPDISRYRLAGEILLFTIGWVALFLVGLHWLGHSQQTVLVLMGITGGGILWSRIPWVQLRAEAAGKTGDYLLGVFAFSLSLRGDWAGFLSHTSPVLMLTAFSMTLSILLHLIFCRLTATDRDTFMISSTAAIYGPPFVTQIAGVLGNRTLLLPGILAGLVGYAAGNYVGLAVYGLLSLALP